MDEFRADEAARRLVEAGPNALPGGQRHPWLTIIAYTAPRVSAAACTHAPSAMRTRVKKEDSKRGRESACASLSLSPYRVQPLWERNKHFYIQLN